MTENQGKPPRKRRPPSRRGGKAADQPKDGYRDGRSEHPEEAVGAHAAFVAAHFGGGAAATPDLLDRAIDVWQRLPGAVVRGAPLTRPNRPTSDPGGETR
jgi:hypothetical protein